jgi:catechol 1,2-dioxygenase
MVEADELTLAAIYLFGIKPLEVEYGKAYADPEKDGASTFMPTGPAYVPDAPEISNPGVLPMAPDEPGEPLIVSGVVRSTSGKPLAGAVVDLWQTTADGTYGGLAPEQAAPLAPLGVVDFDLLKYHLRGKIVTDAEGRFEYRTVVPGLESVTPPGPPQDVPAHAGTFQHMLGRDTSRARHIHAYVSHEGHHRLTHQVHFDDDPVVDTVSEGAVARSLIYASVRHSDPAEWETRGLTGPFRTLTCDYVLRPIGFDEVKDPYLLQGFWTE